MGIGGISIWQLLIILVIVILLFGTKKLRNMGGDIGSAIKNFRKSVREGDGDAEDGDEDNTARREVEDQTEGRVIDAEVKKESDSGSKDKERQA
jgi:sec-independent protein translocase protein TatA